MEATLTWYRARGAIRMPLGPIRVPTLHDSVGPTAAKGTVHRRALSLSLPLRHRTFCGRTGARSRQRIIAAAPRSLSGIGPHSDLSIFQKIGVAGPSSTPESDFRQALGARYCPSGT